MAEAATSEGGEDGKLRPSSTNNGGKKRIVRQPNRRQFERNLQDLTEKISAKESELKSLGRPNSESSPAETAERENLIKEQKSIRELKEATITKRKEFDDDIHKLSDDISKKSDVLSRLKANLPHKTEKAIDDNIRKLEYQLQTQHFKLREEKRIVDEITKLKRSKRGVHEYVAKRNEIDSCIKKKEEMKRERNIYFKKVTSLKSKEDEVRQKLLRMKSKTDEAWTRYREAGPERDRIKKEIDSLYDMRRHLSEDFKMQMREYREFSELQRVENERQKEDEKRAREANHRREWFEYETTREPFSEERAQIECLQAYLQRLLPKGEGQSLSQGGSPLSGASPSSSVSSLGRSSSFKDEEGTYTILRKKGDDDEEVFEKAANSKKKKSKRKSWLSKPLHHTRDIFNQFVSLDIPAPSTAMEIQDSLDRLSTKMQYYEDAAASVRLAHSAIPQDLSASSSFSSGIVTATDVEDTYDFPDDLPLDVVAGVSSPGTWGPSGEGKTENSANTAANMRGNKLGGDGDSSQKGIVVDVVFQSLPSIREPCSVEESDVAVDSVTLDSLKSVDESVTANSQNAAYEVGSTKQQVEGSTHSYESGSSGSDDGKEAGDVTDDSESTVVANESESGQISPGDGSVDSKELQIEPAKTSLDTDPTLSESGVIPMMSKLVMSVGEGEVDVDREDSGTADVQEGESRKGGIAERKNEKLKLIVSRKTEKDIETKGDLLTSSQMEYSSDYASNSTGSAVSTPTDVALKREPLLDASSLLRDPSEVEMSGIDLGCLDEGESECLLNANNNSSNFESKLDSQHPLQRPHLGSFGQEPTEDDESEQFDVQTDPLDFTLRDPTL